MSCVLRAPVDAYLRFENGRCHFRDDTDFFFNYQQIFSTRLKTKEAM